MSWEYMITKLWGITAIGWSYTTCPMMQYSHDMMTWYIHIPTCLLGPCPASSAKFLGHLLGTYPAWIGSFDTSVLLHQLPWLSAMSQGQWMLVMVAGVVEKAGTYRTRSKEQCCLLLLDFLVIWHLFLYCNQILGVTIIGVMSEGMAPLTPGLLRWVGFLVSHRGSGCCSRCQCLWL